MQATAILLAAGLGTRMKSALPKTLHKIAGRSMLRHLLASCEAVFDRVVVVLGPDMDAVAKEAAPHTCVIQHERLGTAHAALQAVEHFGDGEVAVLYADNPLIRPETLRRLLERRRAGDAGLALLAFRPADPGRYGRVIVQRRPRRADRRMGRRHRSRTRDRSVQRRRAVRRRRRHGALADGGARRQRQGRILPHRRRGAGARRAGARSPPWKRRPRNSPGVNSRAELAAAEAVVQGWLRHAAMEAGVTMIDPSSVFLRADTQFEPDVTIEPNVVFGDRREGGARCA